MREHEERVVRERHHLREKIEKLTAFIKGDTAAYKEIPLMEKERLHLQNYLMRKYLDVLDDRIRYFRETE